LIHRLALVELRGERETMNQDLTSKPENRMLDTSCARNQEPLYVDVGTLLATELTGIGRFSARLLEALVRLRPLRLLTTIPEMLARSTKQCPALPCGYEIAVASEDLPEADADVGEWARRLFQRPRRRHDVRLARECPGLFTLLRPATRHFRRELGILYDFTPLVLPRTHAAETREHFGRFFTRTAGLCDKVVAISEATKMDASWLCTVPNADVVVGYPGPSLCARCHAHPGQVARSEHIILVVSTLEPRKNSRFLLDWFLQTKVLERGMELWWVGPTGWWASQDWLGDLVRRRRRDCDRRTNIRFLGMVSDRRLCELYCRAAFTIYPSLYEGFGFPVLDALLHDTPVVCSFHSSLQEFAGPGVFYFDACDPVSLDAACRELYTSRPAAIDAVGLRRRFSWDGLARTVLSLCA
jgi:glycosyltransferase involved in cell wall biosynthesis